METALTIKITNLSLKSLCSTFDEFLKRFKYLRLLVSFNGPSVSIHLLKALSLAVFSLCSFPRCPHSHPSLCFHQWLPCLHFQLSPTHPTMLFPQVSKLISYKNESSFLPKFLFLLYFLLCFFFFNKEIIYHAVQLENLDTVDSDVSYTPHQVSHPILHLTWHFFCTISPHFLSWPSLPHLLPVQWFCVVPSPLAVASPGNLSEM